MTCRCKVPQSEPMHGVVKPCDSCDSCKADSNVRLCAFTVPTLEEGRYYKNSFVYVEDENTTYYIDGNRSEIPFGSRPYYIDDFDPEAGPEYRNALVYDIKNSLMYIYNSKGEMLQVPLGKAEVELKEGKGIVITTEGGEYTISVDDTIATKEELGEEAIARTAADQNLQTQIDSIVNSSDVKDVVGTKAELDSYDTSALGKNDIIKVLQDESENGATTYYRWDGTKFDLVGEIGPYYTKAETDAKISPVSQQVETNTQDISEALGQIAALDADKLGIDNILEGAGVTITKEGEGRETKLTISAEGGGGSGVEVVQTTGTSETAVMSQKAVTDIVQAASPAIGQGSTATGTNSIAIGSGAQASVASTTAVGNSAQATAQNATAIGSAARATKTGAIGLGATSRAEEAGVMNIGPYVASYGYKSTNYRLLTGLYDPQDDHDAATKGYVDQAVAEAGGVEVTQEPGGSTTAVMSQDAVSKLIYTNTTNRNSIKIGDGANGGTDSLRTVTVGKDASATATRAVALGTGALTGEAYSVALGAGSTTTTSGEVSIGGSGLGNSGYDSTSTRLLTNVHDPISAQDAATKNYVDKLKLGDYIFESKTLTWDASSIYSLYSGNKGKFNIPDVLPGRYVVAIHITSGTIVTREQSTPSLGIIGATLGNPKGQKVSLTSGTQVNTGNLWLTGLIDTTSTNLGFYLGISSDLEGAHLLTDTTITIDTVIATKIA